MVFGAMESRARKIEQELPSLIQAGDWEQIAKLVQVPETEWRGIGTKKYKELCRQNIEAKDAHKIMSAPAMIRAAVKWAKDFDRNLAEKIRNDFSSLEGFAKEST